MPALEVLADHVGPRFQAALLELRLHLLGVPRLHAPGDVIDDAGDRRVEATARVVEDEREPELAREVKALSDAKYAWSDGLIVEIAAETRGQ